MRMDCGPPRYSTAAPGPVSFLGWRRSVSSEVHVANPDALLKALDGPVVKYVR